ncbi:hypothetical protein vBKpMFBKp34_013 [Klebsiella phage vB_KpM_FBKp34]|nr:hypothetical protein vBKpMFBKp34_013 [Klebsiella phage vB_KpM_FBKp34]
MSEKMITIPTSLITELIPYIKFGLDKSAEDMGKAGYSPSEEMADDYNRFKILKSLLEYE